MLTEDEKLQLWENTRHQCLGLKDFADAVEQAVLTKIALNTKPIATIRRNGNAPMDISFTEDTDWGTLLPHDYKLYGNPIPPTTVPPTLIDALVQSQRQVDQDGTLIGVSRQALDEAIHILKTLQS